MSTDSYTMQQKLVSELCKAAEKGYNAIDLPPRYNRSY